MPDRIIYDWDNVNMFKALLSENQKAYLGVKKSYFMVLIFSFFASFWNS